MCLQNCWEFVKCGREPGGAKVAELGTCRAATETQAAGIHRGTNGGRCCWAIAGSFSVLAMGERTVHSVCVLQGDSCLDCEFYWAVQREEGENWLTANAILDRLSQAGPSDPNAEQ